MVLELSKELVERGHEVRVAGLVETDEYPDARYAGIARRFLLRTDEYRWPWCIPDAAKRLSGLMRNERVDVLAIHTPTTALVAAAAKLAPPSFWVFHGYGDLTRPWGVRMLARRWGDRWAYRRLGRRAVVVEQAIARAAASHLACEEAAIHVVRNGIDLAEFPLQQRVADASPVICIVGTLSPIKRVDHAIRAFAVLAHQVPGATLRVIGEGSERPRLEALIVKLGVGASVQLLGRRTDVPSQLAAASLFWQLSTSEGLPVAIIEAMATGLPVVATDVRGIRAVVEHGRTGFLVNLDGYEDLVRQSVTLLSNAALRAEFGLAARQRAEREFSVGRMVAEYEALFARAVG